MMSISTAAVSNSRGRVEDQRGDTMIFTWIADVWGKAEGEPRIDNKTDRDRDLESWLVVCQLWTSADIKSGRPSSSGDL